MDVNNYLEENLECDQEYFYRVSAFLGYWTDHSNITSITLGTLNVCSQKVYPDDYVLHQNFPNPFNPITILSYDLPKNGLVKITVYDMLGNVVNNLINTSQSSGYKSLLWNATNNQGQPVSALSLIHI